MTGIRKKVIARVGAKSLIGTGNNFPVGWGNYFWLRDPEARVANFWAENLTESVNRFLTDGLVEIVEWETRIDKWDVKFAIIDDAKIPADWYYDKMCFTGGRRPPYEIAKEMYEIRKYPEIDNELEQWTDPVSYYAKRGCSYDPETGCVSYRLKN